MTNSEVSKAIKILDKEGKWHSLSVESLNGKYTINDILVTSNNDKWINISRPTSQACLTVVTNSNSLDEATSYEFKNFIDTDNNDFSPNNYTCMAEDKSGYIWIGTNKGAIYLYTLLSIIHASILKYNSQIAFLCFSLSFFCIKIKNIPKLV